MYEIFMSNFVTLFLIAGFILLLATGNVFSKRIERLFSIGALCVLALIMVDIADTYFSHQPTLNPLRYWSSALGYTIRPMTLGIFISILLRKRRNYFYLWLPIIVACIIAMTNYWTHIMFYFDQNNVFYRGPLGLLPHSLSLTYMGLLLYYSIARFNTTDFGEMLLVVYIVAICLIAMYFETFYSMKYLLTGAITCACMVYFTYLYVQIYKTDVVTSLFNRHSFEKDSEKRRKRKMVLICVDLNNLKQINDTEGHIKGDEALCVIADVLLEVSENKYRVYRLGGDEFFVVGVNKTLDDAHKYIDKVKSKLSETKYRASLGCAIYKPGDIFSEVCVKADEEMYKDKLNMKNNAINL